MVASVPRGGGSRPAELGEIVEGPVVVPAAPEYERERKLWNARFEHLRPLAVVKVAGAEDVRRVIGFAREHDLPVAARNGGHSYGGYSMAHGGLVVDVSDVARVEVSDDRTRARLGAGATVLPTYRALWPYRLAVPGGTCPTVGITGLTAGGGLGVLGRVHGLTCDSLVAAELVTAEGDLVHASEDENRDLFWALRGGGGGNFGIVVDQTFRVVPVDMPFTHASVEFEWATAAAVTASWQEWAHGVPRELWSGLVMETSDAGPRVVVEAMFAGDPAGVDPLVDELTAAVGAPPRALERSSSEFVTVPSDFYCKGLRPEECRTADLFPQGKLPHFAYYAKSDVAKRAWPSAGIDALVDAIEKRQRDPVLTPRDFDPQSDAGKYFLEIADGAVGAVAPDATAFPHRDALFVSQYESRWRKNASPETADANFAWLNQLYAAVEPFRSGCSYLGYIDPQLENWEHAYYGANLPRLRRIKAKFDPDNFFRFARSIPPG